MKHVHLYKDINLQCISFKDQPLQKIKQFNIDDNNISKTIVYIDMLYNNKPIYIQLSECDLVFMNVNKHSAKIQIDNDFAVNFIKPLEQHIINSLYKNSQKLFNGKQFAVNKLKKCLISNITEKNELNLTINDNIMIYIGKKNINIIEFENIYRDYKLQIIPLIKLANLQFIDNRYTCNIILEQIIVKSDQYLDEYSIYDNITDSSSTLEDEYYKNSDEIDSDNVPFF